MLFYLVLCAICRTLDGVSRMSGADGLLRSAGRSPGPQVLLTDDAVDPVLPSSTRRSQVDNDPERPIDPQGSGSCFEFSS